MALIQCPDCGKMHSDIAPSCPECGRPNITTVSNSSNDSTVEHENTVNEQPKKKSMRPIFKFFLVFLLFLLFTGAVTSYTMKANNITNHKADQFEVSCAKQYALMHAGLNQNDWQDVKWKSVELMSSDSYGRHIVFIDAEYKAANGMSKRITGFAIITDTNETDKTFKGNWMDADSRITKNRQVEIIEKVYNWNTEPTEFEYDHTTPSDISDHM